MLSLLVSVAGVTRFYTIQLSVDSQSRKGGIE